MTYFYRCAKGHISRFNSPLLCKSTDSKAQRCLDPNCKETIGHDLQTDQTGISKTKDDVWYRSASNRVMKRKRDQGVTEEDILYNDRKKRIKLTSGHPGFLPNQGGGRPDKSSLSGMMNNNNARISKNKTLSGQTFCLCWYGLNSGLTAQQDILEITNPYWSNDRKDKSLLEQHFDECYQMIKDAHSNQGSTEVVGEAASAIYMMSMKRYQLRRGIAKGTGIDQIWEDTKSKAYVIVEAKGPGAFMPNDSRYFPQMSRPWVVHNLARMTKSQDKGDQDIANEIIKNCGIGYTTYSPGKYQIGITATSNPDYNSYTIYTYDPNTSKKGTHQLYGWVVTAAWNDSGLIGTKAAMMNGSQYF